MSASLRAFLCSTALAAAIGLALVQPGAAVTVPGAARVEPSVVYLEIPPASGGNRIGAGESGTGFVVASDSVASYAVTAAHVLDCDTYGNGCKNTIAVRFPRDPANPLVGEAVYTGAATPTEDFAIVRIPRGGLPSVALAQAKVPEQIAALGYPDSLLDTIRRASTLPATLAPLLRDGTMSQLDNYGQRLVMTIATNHGDSGGPIFDASSGAVVGLVHGAAGESPSAERFAIASYGLRGIIGSATAAMKDTPGTSADAAARATLLYLGAIRAATRYNFLRLRFINFTTSGTQALEGLSRTLFLKAVDAGSVDAAAYIASSFLDRGWIIGRPDIIDILGRAAETGNAKAAFALYLYISAQLSTPTLFANMPRSEQPAADAMRYLLMAGNGGEGAAMSALATVYDNGTFGVAKNPATAANWRARAGAVNEKLVAAGNAAAAYTLAHDYFLTNLFGHFNDMEHRNTLVADYRKAADLGSLEALAAMAIYLQSGSPDEQAEIFRRLSTAVESGRYNRQIADALAALYEQGHGTPVDPRRALDAYAHADSLVLLNDSPNNPYPPELQTKLTVLTPGGKEIASSLPSSAGYAAAAASAVRINVPNPYFGFGGISDQAYGVLLKASGPGAIVATAAYNLHCDSFARKCQVPSSVEFGTSTDKHPKVTIVRAADTSLENGIALLRVDDLTPPPGGADVATAAPKTVMSLPYAGATAYWGIVLDGGPQSNVLQLALPSREEIGAGIFDLDTGKLVGMYTDPFDLMHATGTAAIARARHEAGV